MINNTQVSCEKWCPELIYFSKKGYENMEDRQPTYSFKAILLKEVGINKMVAWLKKFFALSVSID